MPKIHGNTIAEHRARTRAQLFDALRALIAERGYDSITLADIAERAGVGRTAMYNHFPDKESVLLAMAREETDAYAALLQEQLAGHSDPLTKLTVFLRAQITELAGHHIPMTAISSALSDTARTELRYHVEPLTTILAGIVREALAAGQIDQQDPAAAAGMISAVTAGHYLSGLRGDELEEAIQQAIGFVLRGLGADSAS